MAVPSLQTRVLYGLRTDIIGNAHYITDAEILYPVGNVIAVHNIPQHRQRIIRLPDKHHVNIVCVGPNKRYVAICETGDKPTISVYDLQTLKRRKSLGIPYEAVGVTKFSCIGFTFDGKYIAAVTGEPDQTMLFYNWEKGKVESSLKVGNPQNLVATINLIATNPSDAGVIALGGPHSFKFLTVSETIWRPYGFSKSENILICSMAWINPDRLLAGTKDGRILYLENGDLKNIYGMTETVLMNLQIREEYVIQTTGSQVTVDFTQQDELWESDIRSLISFQRGFAYALGPGTVYVFEKQGRHKYVKRNIYVMPEQVSKDENPDLYRVNTINVNLSSDRLIISTGWNQLFYAALWGPDLNMDPEPQKLKIVGQPLHYGPISSLSMCAWKPIFMTCGEMDRSVRLWDFETESLILLKQYAEDICSISLHPTGLFCLIGFTDKLRFMTILIDDLLPVHEFPIRNCKIVLFSNSGHLFAAVNGNIIQVYTTIGFHNHFLFKGHTGRVKCLIWSQTDLKLISMGTEGAIYQWDMCSGQRSGEIILKGIVLQDVVLSSDTSFMYCIANDNKIREIKDDAVFREYAVTGFEIYYIIMGKDDTIIFGISPGGIIASLKSPIQEPIEHIDFHLHCTDVTKIALSYNEQYLVSVAMDGSLCIWKLYFPEGKVGKIDVKYTNEVLIGKGDLVEKIETIRVLTTRLGEVETEHAYKMRQMEILHNEKLREVHQGYYEAIEELKNNIEKLQEDHASEINNINIEIMKMKASHEEAMQQMEADYDAKLIAEYDKYQKFEERTNIMRQDYENRLDALEKYRQIELERTVTRYEAQLYEKTEQLAVTHDEMEQQAKVHEKLLQEIENDADQEIVQLRTNFEASLYEEKQANLKLKGEAGLMRNKFIASQKDIEDLKRSVQRAQGEYIQFQKTLQNFERDIADLKKEISERDTAIQEKEREVYNLKRTIQELEKFRFVLNYKIRELKNQIEPRDLEIVELKDKISDMEKELVNLHKTNINLELQLRELREKLTAAQKEIQNETERNTRCQSLLKRIRTDILDTAGLIQEPHDLKIAVTSLYHKYSASDDFLRTRKADLEAQCEFMRQRNHLERTVASLQKQVFQDTSSGNKDLDKLMEENIVLITELNALREELKIMQTHISHMESLLGLKRKDIKPTEAKMKLENACQGNEDLKNEYNIQIRDCQQIIASLKDDLERLLNKLPDRDVEMVRLSL